MKTPRTSLFIFALLLLAYLASAQSSIGLPPSWTWQNPLPQGYALTDVHGFNDSTAVVIGGSGLMMKTTNTGRTWQVCVSGTTFDLQRVQFVTDRIGWLGYTTQPPFAGTTPPPGRGELRKTTDGGLTWTVQPLGPWASDVYFQDFWFLSSMEGYALVTRSLVTYLLHTQDGGGTWTPSPAPVSRGASAACLQFLDSTHGWVASYTDNLARGAVQHTADGGLTWQDRTPNPDVEVRALAFLNDTTGWVGGYAHVGSTASPVYATQNRGQTWQPQTFGSRQVTGVSFANPQHGLAHTFGGPVVITADGGNTWPYGNTPSNVRRVRLLTTGVGWAVGAGGRVDRTTDFGTTWTRCNAMVTDRTLRRLQFPDPVHGWALPVNDQALLKTSARGAPWQRLPLTAVPGVAWTAGGQIEAMDFVDRDTGYVAVTDVAGTNRYFVLKTTTAGQTWAVQQVVPPPVVSLAYNYSGLFFRTARHGVVLWGSRGLMLTQDGGATWQTPSVGTRKNLTAVSWATARVAYAVGDSATVVKTTDGGTTWQLTPSLQSVLGGAYHLSEVHFVSAQTGYVTSPYGGLYRTTDGAQTWTQVPGVPGVYHLFFANARRGWAQGVGVYATADGGQTWTPGPAAPPLFGSAGGVVDEYNAWLGDFYGVIARYSAKSLTTAPLVQTALCTGDSLDVAFVREGTFSAAEQAVRVELSNARGRFRPGETRLLGQGTASPVRVGFPAGLAAGALYRVRVIRGDSSVLGADNGQDLRLTPTPLAPQLTTLPGQVLQATLLAGSSVATGYEWEVGGAPVVGATGSQLTPRTSGAYRVRACSATCCGPWSAPSAVVLATKSATAQPLALYPNPARTTLWLERPAGAPAATVELLDITGRVYWRGAVDGGQYSISVGTAPTGVYLVRVQTTTGAPVVVRVVIEH